MKQKKTIIKIAYLGLFLSFSMIISYVETFIPVFPLAPGVKLGLANGFILLIFYLYGPKEAAIINLTRVILSSFLFGNMYAMIYSLSGAIISFLIMLAFYKKKDVFSPIGIGMLGGLFHNLGQIAVAFLVTHLPGLLYYVPILIASGLLCGSMTGLLCKLLYPTLNKIVSSEKGV